MKNSFKIKITVNEDFVIEIDIHRSSLSIYSGGIISPNQFTVEYRGISPDTYSYKFFIKHHLLGGMIISQADYELIEPQIDSALGID